MYDIDELLDKVYASQERVTRDEIYGRAVALDLPAEVVTTLDNLPEGVYSQDALAHHDERTALLEDEYLRRFPDREVDPLRMRAGARGEA